MSTGTLPPEGNARRKLELAVGGGTAAETLTGIAAGTLALLGLFGILPFFYMASIGVIVAGFALFIEGAAIGNAHAKIESEQVGVRPEDMMVDSGFSAQSFGGAAAIVLGILSLLRIMPETLLPVAIMVLGAALLLGGPARAGLRWSALDRQDSTGSARYVTNSAVRGASGLLSLVGVGAIVLGILALSQTGPAGILTLVALLAVGMAEIIGASTMLSRLTVGSRR